MERRGARTGFPCILLGWGLCWLAFSWPGWLTTAAVGKDLIQVEGECRDGAAGNAPRHGWVKDRQAPVSGPSIRSVCAVTQSGRSLTGRDAFNGMLADLPGSGVRVVIVAYASRWARDEFDGFSTLKQLHDAAGCLVVADKALLSTDSARFTELAREIVEAAHYSRELSRNIRDGIAEKVRLRRDVWSHPLLGFRRAGEHRTIQPDPHTMPTAVRAFELAAAGIPDQVIADQLGTTLWRVRGALRSSLYAGTLPDGRLTTFPAPVPQQTWERAQAGSGGVARGAGRSAARWRKAESGKRCPYPSSAACSATSN